MGSDKRSMHTDALETLGMKLSHTEKRDAIHLAVEPVKAGCPLIVGQDICLRNGLAYAVPKDHPDALGIVDPFLRESVQMNERFWLIFYPRQITSLRHVWSHPSFPNVSDLDADPVVKLQAKAWIKAYAESIGTDYAQMMDAAERYVRARVYFNGGDLFEGVATSEVFWEHYEIVEGPVPEDTKGNFFRCSC